ncbi:MAG: ribosome small subunit-dependent GTPase A [Chloroflexi bacterium RBG_16_54_18]|nr:MAG: ribosome small subunit-dependent GTPase A [Chloroflexi bacterium RBG_16_54_18]
MHEQIIGIVIRSQSGFYTVQTPGGEFICRLRGRLLKGKRVGDVVAVGDRVSVVLTGGNNGVIEAVEERKSKISRMAPRPQGDYQQILIANPDQVVLVFSCAQPKPRFGMLDRFLIIAEKQQLPAVIVANKVDLLSIKEAQNMFQVYAGLGYVCVFTSTRNGLGIGMLKVQLANKISLLSGPSGVGKTSLLNAIQPELGLAVRSVSETTTKGRHTTVVRELFPLDGGGFVADTPGLKALGLWDIEAEELDGYFRELSKLVEHCQFNDCTHVSEPGCAVRLALMDGDIDPRRYQSYLRMRFGEVE